jgi:hypothetical protein
MADAGGSYLNIGMQEEKRGRGRPRGSKNKSKGPAVMASLSVPAKQRPGRPVGSKNKPKGSVAASGPSALPRNASPPSPKLYSFFCIAGAQCREIQRVSLKFTEFMDGHELREAVLREHSGGGAPYEVEVWYNGDDKMYFRGGLSHFAEDHDLHQGFFMIFDYHYGTSKFDMKIYDGTQCQKKNMRQKYTFIRCFLDVIFSFYCLM